MENLKKSIFQLMLVFFLATELLLLYPSSAFAAERETEIFSTTLPNTCPIFYRMEITGEAGRTLSIQYKYKNVEEWRSCMAYLCNAKKRPVTGFVTGAFSDGEVSELQLNLASLSEGEYVVRLLLTPAEGCTGYQQKHEEGLFVDGDGVYFSVPTEYEAEYENEKEFMEGSLGEIDPDDLNSYGIMNIAKSFDLERQTLTMSEERLGYLGELAAQAQEIVKESGAETDEEKFAALYSHVIKHTAYDYAGVDANDMSTNNDPLYYYLDGKQYENSAGEKVGVAVCAGMSKYLRNLCVAVGIPSATVVGRLGKLERDSGSFHLWVAAYLNGEWTLHDITHDVHNHVLTNSQYNQFDDPGTFDYYGMPIRRMCQRMHTNGLDWVECMRIIDYGDNDEEGSDSKNTIYTLKAVEGEYEGIYHPEETLEFEVTFE